MAGPASIKRVALDRRDVQPGTDLPFFEATDKSKDPRYQWFRENYGAKCWELDALSPVVLRERVEAQILALLDLDTWRHAIAIEKAETDSMKSIMGAWKSISGPASKYSAPGGSV